MRRFFASPALVETVYLVRCIKTSLGAWVKAWVPELNRHNFSKELENSPQTLSLPKVLALFLTGGWHDGRARANVCLISHLAAISSLGVSVQKGRNRVSLLLWVSLQGCGGFVGGGKNN